MYHICVVAGIFYGQTLFLFNGFFMHDSSHRLRTLVVVNPVSGTRRKQKIIKVLHSRLHKDKFWFHVEKTRYPGHGRELAREAARNGYHVVIAVGGDGLVNEVAAPLMYSQTILGIIPAGSGNGLARHLKIPLNPMKATDVINNFKVAVMDGFVVDNDRFFCNMAGVGFDAHVAKLFHRGKQRGFFKYLKICLMEVLRFKPEKYTLIIDDKKQEHNAFLISFANSSQFGSNAKIAPHASLTDGQMDVCILEKMPPYKVPLAGLALITGKIHKLNLVKYLRTAQAQIIPHKQNACCQMDGEPYPLKNNMTITVKRHSLSVVVPQNTDI